MKQGNWISCIGMIAYIITSIIDKMIQRVPDYIYIPVGILAIVLILWGQYKNRKNKKPLIDK